MSLRVGAVLVAAGSSRRMGFDKLWSPLHGRSVVSYALTTLAASPRLARLVLVVSQERLDDALALVADLDSRATVRVGGAERRDSVAAGTDALDDCDWILVHDAARPFVSLDLVDRGIEAAQLTGAAVAAIPSRDTLKRVVEGAVVETLPRQHIWSVQTPQVFRTDLLRSALRLSDRDVTDEATLVERLGGEVRVFEGSDLNWKITTPGDFALAEALLAAGASRTPRPRPDVARTGASQSNEPAASFS
jgi:2-C-methyl-D-erythritol 4-phosphate cytidylyltransferase